MADSESETNTASHPEHTGKDQERENWERGLLNRLVFAGVAEQRRARRWSIFFKSLFFLYLLVLLFMYLPDDWMTSGAVAGRHTALIDIQGIIAADADASADNIISSLRTAFESESTAGIILRINSPGGSPVQAGYVNDEIVRLRANHPNIPIYAVITDVCASGGYYIAAAADTIYADKASIVGSIGVIMSGFGFVEAMQELGVERRLLTAGENKAFLDPFSPTQEQDVRHIEGMLNEIHQQFINVVQQGRGERLKQSTDLYSGLVWTGEQGLGLGLVDGLGSSSYVAREVIGAEDIVDYTRRMDFLSRFADRIGVAMADVFLAGLGLEEGRLTLR